VILFLIAVLTCVHYSNSACWGGGFYSGILVKRHLFKISKAFTFKVHVSFEKKILQNFTCFLNNNALTNGVWIVSFKSN
jgi:hypothetical protein